MCTRLNICLLNGCSVLIYLLYEHRGNNDDVLALNIYKELFFIAILLKIYSPAFVGELNYSTLPEVFTNTNTLSQLPYCIVIKRPLKNTHFIYYGYSYLYECLCMRTRVRQLINKGLTTDKCPFISSVLQFSYAVIGY